MREFIEQHYKDGMDRAETIKLTVKSLLEVVQTGSKNMEIVVMDIFGIQVFDLIQTLDADQVELVCKEIERENQAEQEKKNKKKE